MAKAKFDLKSIEIPDAAAKPLYAGVGATDLAVEYVRNAVADVQKKVTEVQKDVTVRVQDVQKNVKDFDFEPTALRGQATKTFTAQVDTLTKEAKDRRAQVEARVQELQADAKARAEKVQALVNENVTTVTETYSDLAKRGEDLVGRIRKQDVKKAPAKKAPAKPAAKKAPAKKAAAKKAPAKKATAKN